MIDQDKLKKKKLKISFAVNSFKSSKIFLEFDYVWKMIVLTFGENLKFLRLLVLPKKFNTFYQNMVLHKNSFFIIILDNSENLYIFTFKKYQLDSISYQKNVEIWYFTTQKFDDEQEKKHTLLYNPYINYRTYKWFVGTVKKRLSNQVNFEYL